MYVLVHTKESQEVGWRLIGRGAAFAFPKGCAEVVPLGQHCLFPDVKTVHQCIKVEETTRQLKIRVSDGSIRIIVHDQFVDDLLRPLEPPSQGTLVGIPFAWDEGRAWKPNAAHSCS